MTDFSSILAAAICSIVVAVAVALARRDASLMYRTGLAAGTAAGVAGLVLWLLDHVNLAFPLLAVGVSILILLVVLGRRAGNPDRLSADDMRFRDLFETHLSGVYLFNADGELSAINQRGHLLLKEINCEAQVGMTYGAFTEMLAHSGAISAANRDREAWIAERLEQFGLTSEPRALKLASGRWLRISQRRLPNGDVSIVAIDATEDHERELAVKRKEDLFRELAGLGSDWYWQTDQHHRFTEFGESFGPTSAKLPEASCMKLTRSELADATDLNREAEKWRQHEADLANHRPFHDFEYDHKADGGDALRRLRVSGNPYFDSSGNFLGFRGIARDVTDEVEQRRRADRGHQRLVDALEAIPVAIAIYDSDNQIFLMNTSYRTMMSPIAAFLEPGRPRQDIIAQATKAGLRIWPFDAEASPNHGGSVGRTNTRELHLPDGRCYQVHEQQTIDGGAIVSAIDISELKRQTGELTEKSSILQGTLDSIQQGLAVFGADFRMVACNSRFLSLLEAEELALELGTTMQSMIRRMAEAGIYGSAVDDEEVDELCQRIMACDPPQLTTASASGRMLDVRRSRMPEGGVAVTLTDISDQKQHERELQQKTDELEIVFESMDQGIAVLDSELTITSINGRMLELLGLPHTDPGLFLNLNLNDCIPMLAKAGFYGDAIAEDELGSFVEERLAQWKTRQPFGRERELGNGTVVDMRSTPVKGTGWVVTCRDITRQHHGEAALRIAKEQAELANRAKSEFLANTSHELRTPLNAIIGFSEILMKEMFGPLGSPRYLDYATDINDSGQHLLDIINDLLDLAKVEAGHMDLHEEPTEVKDLVEASLRLVRERAQANLVKLHTDLSDCLASVMVDQRAMKQVLINLLSNAVKFTPEGGRVDIFAGASEDGSIEFRVTDTGIGMAKDDIPKALAPFGQIDGSMARRYHGTGLGLPLARRLTEMHGGTLEVQSEPGNGTAVSVRLPASRHVQHVGRQLAVGR